MRFKDKFPSLIKTYAGGDIPGIVTIGFTPRQIEECCLDKAKVREAIERVKKEEHSLILVGDGCRYCFILDKVKERLGL